MYARDIRIIICIRFISIKIVCQPLFSKIELSYQRFAAEKLLIWLGICCPDKYSSVIKTFLYLSFFFRMTVQVFNNYGCLLNIHLKSRIFLKPFQVGCQPEGIPQNDALFHLIDPAKILVGCDG